jgi:hypothetical protein
MWTLVVCCLVAVGGARPQLDVRDPYASQTPRLHAAPGKTLVLTSRRDTAQAPDFRLPPFVLIEATSIASPARTAVTCEPLDLVPRLAPVAAACSRGPPVS